MRRSKNRTFLSLAGIAAILVLFGFTHDAFSATTWSKVIDFGYTGYSETGNSWRTYTSPQSHNGSYRYLSHWDRGVARVGTATWTVAVPYNGKYRVSISYRRTENRSPDANYFVTNGSGGMDEYIVNQMGDNAYIWRTLGDYEYSAGQAVKVFLDGTDDNYSDCADAARWELLVRYFSITASAGKNGIISPRGITNVTEGGSLTYTITPSENYRIVDVVVDGKSVGAVGSYTFSKVSADHSIAASFRVKSVVAPNVLLLKKKEPEKRE